MCTAVSMSVSNEIQGIGSVLGCSERSKTASLRRTLSADMSSKKWLSKNGFCPLKRIASSEEFQTVNDEEDVLCSKKEDEPPGQTDLWSMIVSQKSETEPTVAYVHPLAKRNRSLSQQSLEICTESLGSETGSDVFSSVPPSETSDEETEEEEEVAEAAVVPAVNYNSYAVRKTPARSFPPPLPSLSQSGLHMRSRRVGGRLVMEAVPVQAPTQSYFQAQREGGRLLLTFVSPKLEETVSTDTNLVKIQEEEEKDEEDMFDEVEDDDDEIEDEVEDEFDDEEEEEEEEYDSEEENYEPVSNRGAALEMKVSQPSPTKKVPTGVINVHRSALMVNKLMGLTNIDPTTWSSKMGKIVNDDQTPLTQSLPVVTRLVPPSATASSFNTYEYGWRTKSSSVAQEPTVCNHPLTQNPQPLNNKNNNFLFPNKLNPQARQEMVLMRGNKADYLVPVFKGCKEPKRSLFIWEPHCIAT